jgi:hypothetical protein
MAFIHPAGLATLELMAEEGVAGGHFYTQMKVESEPSPTELEFGGRDFSGRPGRDGIGDFPRYLRVQFGSLLPAILGEKTADRDGNARARAGRLAFREFVLLPRIRMELLGEDDPDGWGPPASVPEP